MASISIINSGFDGLKVSVECSLSRGLPTTTIVGMATKAVDEAKERLRVAISSSGLEYPKKHIIINLAPADIPKDSSSLDLAMAISILEADKQIPKIGPSNIFIGELGLDGSLRPVRGIVGKLLTIHKSFPGSNVYIPKENELQASMISEVNTFPVEKLIDLVGHLNGSKKIFKTEPLFTDSNLRVDQEIDFGEIHGQDSAKRALLIAAAGGHNVLMTGPPGTGKSMLAKSFIGIIPHLEKNEALESTHIHSLSTNNFDGIIFRAPLRSPHHTSSDVALIGGGHNLKPGEISLAHNGVLFLDELPEFRRSTIESLRQPLEDGKVTISRAQQSATYPANFLLIATSNPCPCGYLYSSTPCSCTPNEIHRYQKKLSGPVLDRIDIHITVGQIDHKDLLKKSAVSESSSMRKKVESTRITQRQRANKLNSNLSNKELKKILIISPEAEELLNKAAAAMSLSARSYIRTLKVARTIADLENSNTVEPNHIAEALQYRPKPIKI